MMTRSGTNVMHGSMNYQYWNNQWNAPRYFAKRNYYTNIEQARARGDNALAESLASQKLNPLGKSNNVANTIGGPVIRDKLFVVRELLVQRRRSSGESDPSHDSDRRAISAEISRTCWRSIRCAIRSTTR